MRARLLYRTIILTAVSLLAVLFIPNVASAQSPDVTFDPPSAPPGTTVVANGHDFVPNGTVTQLAFGTQTTAPVDANGNFRTSFQVPNNIALSGPVTYPILYTETDAPTIEGSGISLVEEYTVLQQPGGTLGGLIEIFNRCINNEIPNDPECRSDVIQEVINNALGEAFGGVSRGLARILPP